MSATMKALRIDRPGGELRIEEIPIPEPGPGEVLVKMAAAPINPSDLATLNLGYLAENWPLTPGLEGAGVVVKAGKGLLPSLRKGRRVACSPNPGGDGTWAEYMCTSAMRVSPLPGKIRMEEGAMLLVNPMTAMALLSIIKKGGHRAVIMNAAASALGKMMIRLLNREGIPLICIVRRRSQLDELKESGARYVLDSSTEDYLPQLGSLTGKLEATLILDAIGGSEGGHILSAAPARSRLLVYARLSGKMLEIDPGGLIREEKGIDGFQLGVWLGKQGLLTKLGLLSRVKKHLQSELSSHIAHRFSLEEGPAALAGYQKNMGEGKSLIVADPSIL